MNNSKILCKIIKIFFMKMCVKVKSLKMYNSIYYFSFYLSKHYKTMSFIELFLRFTHNFIIFILRNETFL